MNHLVLLIEDDPVQALTQQRALEQSGFRVQTAPDGMTGVESVARQEFDAVILDAILPDLDGVDVCRAIRELPMGKKIPVVILTGLSDDVAINGFFKAGATDFISKPAHQLLLRHRLHRLIEASRNEKALSDSLADQERSNRVKSEFASMLAHDIRTPLTGMELALEVLKDDLGSENRILESLRSGIHRIIALSERLLSVYDIEADSISLSPEVFDVERFLHRCLLEATQPANRKKIHFETRFEVGGAFLYGDQRKLGQSIQFLLVNAVTATPSNGKIFLVARLSQESGTSRSRVTIEVTDGGKPVPAEELEYLFDPFRTGYSVEGSLEYTLGLTLARRIIDQHQGNIVARRAGEKGTTFRVDLPLLEK